MQMSDNKFFIKFCLVIVIIIAGFCVFAFLDYINFDLPMENAPEQQEYVTVIDKRVNIRGGKVGRGFESSNNNEYLIKFQFSDGSTKELDVAIIDASASNRGNNHYSINIGDEGMLTFKEIEDVEERYEEKNRYRGRQFIRFERYVVADEK